MKEHAAVFGYDQDGRCHRWNPVTATVVVTVDGDIKHTEELSQEAVPEWIEFVADRCGWIEDEGPRAVSITLAEPADHETWDTPFASERKRWGRDS